MVMFDLSIVCTSNKLTSFGYIESPGNTTMLPSFRYMYICKCSDN